MSWNVSGKSDWNQFILVLSVVNYEQTVVLLSDIILTIKHPKILSFPGILSFIIKQAEGALSSPFLSLLTPAPLVWFCSPLSKGIQKKCMRQGGGHPFPYMLSCCSSLLLVPIITLYTYSIPCKLPPLYALLIQLQEMMEAVPYSLSPTHRPFCLFHFSWKATEGS